jgi:RimJ/RimL family protein N-acetyltransferase
MGWVFQLWPLGFADEQNPAVRPVHPDHRGRGLATAVTAGCCKHLLESVELIGLNVRADNQAAIRAYEKIGFETRAVYHEWMMEPKNSSATFPE